MSQNKENEDTFKQLKQSLLNLDPVSFAQNYLTLEGSQFRLIGNGYKPFADIYRYIGIKALEPDSKPVILVKGRQVGGTIMACVLEMYFMGSGIFGIGSKPPMRVMHAFPLLSLSAAYSKTKLNPMILNSIRESAADKECTTEDTHAHLRNTFSQNPELSIGQPNDHPAHTSCTLS
jgi:hypothetical protein